MNRGAITTLAIVWTHTGDAEFPYTAEVDGRRFTIRINDFPAEPLYTILSEGEELEDLDDWPRAWVMPSPPKALLDLLAPKIAPKAATPRAAESAPRTKLHRLARILEDRAMPTRSLLRAVEIANEARHYLEVSVLARRLTLLLPYRADVLAEIAPAMTLPPAPPRPLLKVFVEGDELAVAVASVISAGTLSPADAIDIAPAPARDAWREAVVVLHDVAPGARMSGRMRFLDRPRALIDVFYEARAQDGADERFAHGLDRVATQLGVSPAQRALFRSIHPSFGGVAVMATTACEANAPSAELAIGWAKTDWDEAVRLCTLVANEDGARDAAAALGLLAGNLQAERMDALTLALRPEGPDVRVLVTLK